MQVARIPKRVPVGTKYVIEGKSVSDREVHISSRYLVFPDGRRFDLPSDSAEPPSQSASVLRNRDRH